MNNNVSKMEELNINVSSLNEEEITQLLLKALKLSNEKSLSLKGKLSQIEQNIRVESLKNEKTRLEKDNTIASLRKDVEDLNKKLVGEQSANQKKLNEKDDVITQITEKFSQQTETNNTLQQNNADLSSEFEQFKLDMFKFAFTESIGKIKQYCQLMESDSEANGIRTYIEKHITTTNVFTDNYKTVEALCNELLQPDGVISSVCNVIWWFNNDNIKELYGAKIVNYNGLIVELNTIAQLLKKYNYKLNIPIAEFCDKVPNYGLYDNGISHIKDVFPDASIPKSALCEIYSVSYNDKSGKCYSL